MSGSPSGRMKIGDFLLRRVEEAGVQHLFGVPGDSPQGQRLPVHVGPLQSDIREAAGN
jgi:hypothetical protein